MKKISIPHNPSTGFLHILLAAFSGFRIVTRQDSPALPLFVIGFFLLVILLILHFAIPYAIFEMNKLTITNNYLSKKQIDWDKVVNIDRVGNKISVKASNNSSYVNINLRQMSKNDREKFLKLFNEESSNTEHHSEIV